MDHVRRHPVKEDWIPDRVRQLSVDDLVHLFLGGNGIIFCHGQENVGMGQATLLELYRVHVACNLAKQVLLGQICQ